MSKWRGSEEMVHVVHDPCGCVWIEEYGDQIAKICESHRKSKSQPVTTPPGDGGLRDVLVKYRARHTENCELTDGRRTNPFTGELVECSCGLTAALGRPAEIQGFVYEAHDIPLERIHDVGDGKIIIVESAEQKEIDHTIMSKYEDHRDNLD